MAKKVWTWRTDRPDDVREVLALVRTVTGVDRWRVLTWVPSRRMWMIEGDPMSRADEVVRWRELEPLTIEKEDVRRPEVTHLVELFRQLNGGRLDHDRLSRKQCHVLLDNMAKVFDKTDPAVAADRLIRAVTSHPKTKGSVTSFLYLNRNLSWIINTVSRNDAAGKLETALGNLAR